ncbi:MAG: SIS domain-containing protein [Pseudomonadota bacterium]
MGNWAQRVDRLRDVLNHISFRSQAGEELTADAGFDLWCQLTHDCHQQRGAIYLIGNGASASLASHFAADLAKNARLHTQVFSDLSLVTAIANDLGYAEVFAEPLRRRGRSTDLLIGISSSGRSPSVLNAVAVAQQIGMRVVTLSGMSPANPLRALGTLNAHVEARSYGTVETCHAAVLHRWMDGMLAGNPGDDELPDQGQGSAQDC